MESIEHLLHRLRLIGERFGAEGRPSFSAAAPNEAIAALQAAIPAPLPHDFVRFLRECDQIQAIDVWNGYWIGGSSALTQSIIRENHPRSIETADGPTAILPIATDGGGNAFHVA